MIKKIVAEKKKELQCKFRIHRQNQLYEKRFLDFSFYGNKCENDKQYEAVITRWYHTIEKGLAYVNFRAGFGNNNINSLLTAMENYIADGYSADSFFYKTALSTLKAYQAKNSEYGFKNEKLDERIKKLPGEPNNAGGVISFSHMEKETIQNMGYAEFINNRHSLRHFSDKPVDKEAVKRALELAQHTPSACNRQGWRTRVIVNKEILKDVLANQNGNQGFGNEIDQLILVTADLRYFNRDREIHQAFIDGGMYAQSILNALHYENIATIPLSASLTIDQEKNVRRLLELHDAEVFIIFIGIGNYPDICQTTMSTRHSADITVI